MHANARIYVAGHQGLVGRALVENLQLQGYSFIITRTFAELDLRNQAAVQLFFEQEKPDYVFLAAARVGGIYANMTHPASFIYDNIMIQSNVIHASYMCGIKKLLFLGSSCIYPRNAAIPITENSLLTGSLEPTNEPYAVAKITGIKMCQAYNKQYDTCFISAMPTNLYGPGDTFDQHYSHVIPALILKMHNAKKNNEPYVTIGGTGTARREFLYVDDCAKALIMLMQHYDDDKLINIGSGDDCNIEQLAYEIKDVVGYRGQLQFNAHYPEGTPVKLLDSSAITYLGWQPHVSLDEGLRLTYEWFLNKF